VLQIHTLLLEVFETVGFLLLAVESLGEKSGSALARAPPPSASSRGWTIQQQMPARSFSARG